MSQANINHFANVNLFFDPNQPGTNFEHLIAVYDMNVGKGSEPPMNSLFNINNMQMLVSLGESTPNIMLNKTLLFTEIVLDPEWTTLTNNLGL
jgi:hypothetical protein